MIANNVMMVDNAMMAKIDDQTTTTTTWTVMVNN